MEKKKLKMNPRKFNIMWTSILAVLLVLIIAATYLMNFFSLSMDIFLGRGAAIVTVPDNVDSWDTNYYTTKYATGEENMEAALDVAQRIAEEGEVLLKNNGVLPLAQGASVTPFGFRYVSPVYGGTGSGNVNTESVYITTPTLALNNYFNVNTEMENALNRGDAYGLAANGYERPSEAGRFSFEGATEQIIEFDPAVYSGHEDSFAGTTGIIFIGRLGGEGRDLLADVEGSAIYGTGFYDGTEHHLQLSEYEKETIRIAKENCDNTVVILNTANVMEIAELLADEGDLAVDAILWIGDPGSRGFEAMGRILCGEVNPSGKTVDIWATDFMSDPVMANFGNFEYENLMVYRGGYPDLVGEPSPADLLEYEENIYLGYRYYETVNDTGGTFDVFGRSGFTYEDAVQIPFGYGLGYETDFSQEITNFSDSGDSIELTVRITNNGSRAGKDVVQVYYNPPYTDYDAQNRIEKATVNLVAFAKTGDIAPGASEDVTITFAKEEMASYSYTRENGDGTSGAYVLEEGDYIISVNANSHEQYDARTFTNGSTIWYDYTNPRQSEIDAQSVMEEDGTLSGVPAKAEIDTDAQFVAASNIFQELSDHMEGTNQLTRANGPLSNTATTPTQAERIAPDSAAPFDENTGTLAFQHFDPLNDEHEILGNQEGSKVYQAEMPVTNASNGLMLSSFRGLSYYDPLWEELLDQLDLDEYNLYVALVASYNQTAGIESIGKPTTVDYDGPQGIVGSILDSFEYTAYPSAPIIAATFNVDLAYEMGEAVGQEAVFAGVNSWYAPAVNIHRSPFSGRNFEYYSEDALLSGRMAANVISGASDQGLITTLKHYAINDQEMYSNNRSRVITWANEQALRENYLKAFEIAVKEARTTIRYISDDEGTVTTKALRGANGIMGSMNYLGYTWAGASYALNTELLRDEWGFQGFVITDMMMNAGSNSIDATLRAGNDTWMAWGDGFTSEFYDTTSPTGIATIRRAVKNMCYSIVNSRAMDGIAPGTIITYKTAPWIIGLTIANVLVYGFIIVMVIVMIRRNKDFKNHPENYKPKKAKKAK